MSRNPLFSAAHCMIRGEYAHFSTGCRVLSSTVRMRSLKEIVNVPVASVPVIRFPQKMAAKMEKALTIKKEHDGRTRQAKWDMADRTVVIQSNRKERNFHLGQSSNKFTAPVLASQTWAGKRSPGDHFTIKARGHNPAMKDCEHDAVPGFEKFQLDQTLMDAIEDLELKVCTNIQNQAIPMILQGDNVLMSAETGSGKTYAYLLPLLHRLIQLEQNRQDTSKNPQIRINSPSLLILVPSRELAQQVYDTVAKLLAYTSLNAHLVIGGERTQRKLNHPRLDVVDVLVATPGVLSKLLTNRLYSLGFLRSLVIDEADTLVDDSFCEVVRGILQYVTVQDGSGREEGDLDTPGTQLVLAGATLPLSLNDTLEGICPAESLTRVRTRNLHRVMPHVKQTFHRVQPSQKSVMILDLVKNGLAAKQTLMVFCNSSTTCDWLTRFLQENDVVAANLNGAMQQRFRRGVFEQFQRGDFRVLVCTDIASRGLDTTAVNHVINYEFPTYISDYIHRCGRTGRVGSHGTSQVTSLVTYPEEVKIVWKIENAVRDAAAYHNVNANITRYVNRKHGQTDEERRSLRAEALGGGKEDF